MDINISVYSYSWIRNVRARGQFSEFSSSASSSNNISKTTASTGMLLVRCFMQSPLSGMDQEWKVNFGCVTGLCFCLGFGLHQTLFISANQVLYLLFSCTTHNEIPSSDTVTWTETLSLVGCSISFYKDMVTSQIWISDIYLKVFICVPVFRCVCPDDGTDGQGAKSWHRFSESYLWATWWRW